MVGNIFNRIGVTPQFKGNYKSVNKKTDNFSDGSSGRRENLKKNGNSEFVCIYSNDTHGSLDNMTKLMTGIRGSQEKLKAKNPITVSTADNLLYENHLNPQSKTDRLTLLLEMVNSMRFDVVGLGNHEFDNGIKFLAKLLKGANFKTITTNLTDMDDFKDLKKEGKFAESCIIERNGQKYGFVAAYPVNDYPMHEKTIDLNKHIAGVVLEKEDFVFSNLNDHKNLNYGLVTEQRFENTQDYLKNEVDKLQKQGVNKIILLSHLGYEYDKKLVEDPKQRAEGIDIIIGGHSHDVIDGINVNDGKNNSGETTYKNLFYSKKGDPVVITQGGCNADYYGILDLWFDKKGKIVVDKAKVPVEAENKLISTKNITPNADLHRKFSEKISDIFKDYPPIGNLTEDVIPDLSRKRENYLLTVTLDGAKQMLAENGIKADMVLANSSFVRAGLTKGPKNEGSVSLPFSFEDKLGYVDLRREQLVNAINQMLDYGNKRGGHDIPQFSSNVKYEVTESQNNQLKLKKLEIDGENIDIVPEPFKPGSTYLDPNEKIYRVAIREFLSYGSVAPQLNFPDPCDDNYVECKYKGTDQSIHLNDCLAYYIKNNKVDSDGNFTLKQPDSPNIKVSIEDDSKTFAHV